VPEKRRSSKHRKFTVGSRIVFDQFLPFLSVVLTEEVEKPVIRFFKWILVLTLLTAVLTAVWIGLGLWVGYYSVYSYPPSETHPDGASLIIDRDDGEPLYNSPDYIKPPRKKGGTGPGIKFGTTEFRRMKPPELRTVLSLPFIEYAYMESLNEAQQKKFREGTLHRKPGKEGRSR